MPPSKIKIRAVKDFPVPTKKNVDTQLFWKGRVLPVPLMDPFKSKTNEKK